MVCAYHTAVFLVHRSCLCHTKYFVLIINNDAYFLTWNPKISGKQAFSAFPKIFPYFLSFQEKKESFGGGTKIIIPGWSMHYIKHEYLYTILSGLWAVIFSHFHSTQ